MSNDEKDDRAALLPADPISEVTTETLPNLPPAVQAVVDQVTEQRRRDLVELEKRLWGIFP